MNPMIPMVMMETLMIRTGREVETRMMGETTSMKVRMKKMT